MKIRLKTGEVMCEPLGDSGLIEIVRKRKELRPLHGMVVGTGQNVLELEKGDKVCFMNNKGKTINIDKSYILIREEDVLGKWLK
jgi:co-chaperonin GroES (HSP10)